jgi:UDP-2-acetamido-2-deoxy-ribo-hexuluronate aminotransferase
VKKDNNKAVVEMELTIIRNTQAGSAAVAEGAAEARLRLENRLAGYVGAEYCALAASGTAGMLAALRAAGVCPGDYVLCTAFSYFCTPEIIQAAHAKPLLADINPNSYSLDPYCLEYALKKCEREEQPLPRAVVAADIFGLCCDYEAIEQICEKHKVALIEDMSCAFGASFRGRRAGTFGRFAVASFYPTRPLGGEGEGGAVFCRSVEDLKPLRQLLGGRDGDTPAESFVRSSALGERLGAHSEELSRRQLIAARYRDNLADAVRLQQIGEDCISACTQFAIGLEDESTRDAVAEHLRENRVPCAAVPRLRAGALREKNSAPPLPPATQNAAKRLLLLPINPHLSMRVVDYICSLILEIVRE